MSRQNFMRHFFDLILLTALSGAAFAGEPKAADAKAMTAVEEGPLYLGSINSGFKASRDYFDANLNLVAPVWSSLGSDGFLGGGVLFVEPYVSWGEQGEVATSLGLGYRYLFSDEPVSALRSPRKDQAGFWDEGLAIGASVFADMLDTESDNQFWQLGFGLEVTTRYIELRGNYYLPLTDKQLAERRVFTEKRTSSRTTTKPVTQTGAPYDNGQGFLVQDQTTSLVATTTTTNTFIRHVFSRYEEGMEGWDAEIALLVPGLDKYCDVKLIGGYFSLNNSPFGPQKGGTGNVEGWKAGIEVRPVPAIALTGMWYEDERFLGSDWMVGARMEIPFEMGDLGDGKGMWGRIRDAFTPRRRHLVERLAEPVHRQNTAIHLASTTEQSAKVSKQTSSTNTQVVSQTQNKIVLGPGPSGTEFKYASSGTLTLGGTSPQSVNGSLYLNKAGQSVFIPEGGGAAMLFSNNIGSAYGAVNPSMLGSAIHVSNNVFLNNASAGFSISSPSGATSHYVPLLPAGGIIVLANSTTTSSGMIIGSVAGNGSSSIIRTNAGSLVLSGANTYTAGITLNATGAQGTTGATLIMNNDTSSNADATRTIIGTASLGTAGTSVIGLNQFALTTAGGTFDTARLNLGNIVSLANLSSIPAGSGTVNAGTVNLSNSPTVGGAANFLILPSNGGSLTTAGGVTPGGTGNLIVGTDSTFPVGTANLTIGSSTGTGLSAITVTNGYANINGSPVYVGNLTSLTGGALLRVGSGGTTTTVDLTNATLTGGTGTVITTGPTTTGGIITLTGGTQLGGTGTVVSGTTTSGGTLNLLNGGLIGATGLIKTGAGELTLMPGNIYSGSITVVGGTLHMSSANVVASSLVLPNGGTVNGTSVSAGTYPITNGAINVNGAAIELIGTSIVAPITTP